MSLVFDRGIARALPVFKHVTGKRLIYRPLAGVNETISVGIARTKNGDITPAGEKFSEILRKISKAGTVAERKSRAAKVNQ